MININFITDLINNLPNIIESIMYGYIFITIYEFVSFKDTVDKKYKLISSIVANYILMNLFTFIHVDNIVLKLILSVLFGCIIATVIYSGVWNNLLLNIFKIKRTSHANIWDDAIQNSCGVEVFEKNSNISYYGICNYVEQFERYPIIILSKYQVLEDGELKNEELDFSNDNTKTIVLNLKDFEKVKIYE